MTFPMASKRSSEGYRGVGSARASPPCGAPQRGRRQAPTVERRYATDSPPHPRGGARSNRSPNVPHDARGEGAVNGARPRERSCGRRAGERVGSRDGGVCVRTPGDSSRRIEPGPLTEMSQRSALHLVDVSSIAIQSTDPSPPRARPADDVANSVSDGRRSSRGRLTETRVRTMLTT